MLKNHDHKQPCYLPEHPEQEPDLQKTIPQNFLSAVSLFQDLPMLSYRAGLATVEKEAVDCYKSITYKQSLVYINAIVQQISSLNFKSADRVIIYGKNSPLWMLSAYAIAFLDGIMVPLYDTLGIDNIRYCINLVSAKYVVVTSEYVHNIIGMLDELESLEFIILMDNIDDITRIGSHAFKVSTNFPQNYPLIDDDSSFWSHYGRKQEMSSSLQPLDFTPALELLTTGEVVYKQRKIRLMQMSIPTDYSDPAIEKAQRELKLPENQTANQPSCVIFSSGTSGDPKGVVLSHSNVYAGAFCLSFRYIPYHLTVNGEQSSTLSYLPLAHIFEYAYEHYLIKHGYNIYYSCGNIKNIATDLRLAKPSLLIGVPRVYQKIYDQFMTAMAQQKLHIRIVFSICYFLKNMYLCSFPSTYATGKCGLLDRLVFHKVSDIFGGNVEMMISGSSAMPDRVFNFLRVCGCAKLTSGYGATETSAAGLYSYSGQKMYSASQLGYVCSQTEGKLVDVADQCEFSLKRDQIGELCIRSPGVALGYINGKWGELRKIDDAEGYYHTGDLCKVNKNGSATFLRRISNVVKLQHGEFVDLRKIESVLEASPLIDGAFVYAEADKPAPVCILQIDWKVVEAKHGQLTEEELKQILLVEIDRLVRNSGMKGFNVPKAVYIERSMEWMNNRDLFTPSGKKRSTGFQKVYKRQLNELFNELCARNKKTAKSIISLKGVLLILFGILFLSGGVFILQ